MIATHFRLLFRSSSNTVYPLIRYEVELNFLLLRRKRCVDSLDIAAHVILRQMRSYEAVGGLYQHGRYEAAAMVVGWVSKEVSRMLMIFGFVSRHFAPFFFPSLDCQTDSVKKNGVYLSLVNPFDRNIARRPDIKCSSANIYHRATMVTNRRMEENVYQSSVRRKSMLHC
jgi:hypothetical protein